MSAMPLTKIVLKSTTKMSLNERFTAYRNAQSTMTTIRQNIQQQRQASFKNRRLAQQMANRPSVIAALKLKKRSLKQRLGQQPSTTSGTSGNVKARLYLGGRRNTTSLQNRLGGQRSGRGRSVVSFQRGTRRSRGTGGIRPGTSPMLKARLGNPNLSSSKSSGGRKNANRGTYKRGRGNFGRGSRQRQQRGGFRGQYRNTNRRSNGRGRGGWSRNAGGRRQGMPTKQELDNQLDEYMARTRSHLDAELDAYMAQSDS